MALGWCPGVPLCCLLQEGRGASSSTFEGQGEKECLVCRRRGDAGVRGGWLGRIIPYHHLERVVATLDLHWSV